MHPWVSRVGFQGCRTEVGTYHARSVMAEVGKDARFQNRKSISIMIFLGIVLGATGCYYWFVRDLNQINDRLDTIQQQLTLAGSGSGSGSGAAAGRREGCERPSPPMRGFASPTCPDKGQNLLVISGVGRSLQFSINQGLV
jgi:hypothetical protein